MTVFLRTRMDVDVVHANKYLGALFYSLAILLVDGLPELFLTTSVSMFRFVASLCRNIVVSTTSSSLIVLLVVLFGGFIIPKSSMPVWLKWAFSFSPLAYGEIGLTVNEFHAPRWQKLRVIDGSAHVFHHVIKGLRTCDEYPNWMMNQYRSCYRARCA
ncbi:hypothetical protein POM88_000626 [Heracleum sosnowskyi]|uniref:ABC-2 type transporter transmembrane domain-containing protein n=1 Tax=Heracleum sosnowskyi TaxID=360622 RepID=A0AAD8JEA2_9APIA|nr:hypothetical protein POM88_000626 [Heracleum sosnowskyi]